VHVCNWLQQQTGHPVSRAVENNDPKHLLLLLLFLFFFGRRRRKPFGAGLISKRCEKSSSQSNWKKMKRIKD
jgi:hypothetical protein